MTLSTANGETNGEIKKVGIEFTGNRFLVPEGMSYDDAISHLSRQKGEDSTYVSISEKIHCFPMDGAVALTRALQRKYGWTNLEPTPSFFGPQPPALIGVEIGFEETIQVPWGRMTVPKIAGHVAHSQEAIYSASIEQAIMVNLLNLIRYSEQCRKNGIPLKRGVLLGGPYGTGKTLTAYKTIVECVKHGWTFLYLEDVRDLELAIPFAQLYQPCVLFAEDVDRAVGPLRDATTDRILNTLDGITSKNCEIITILTTNHLPAINRAMLRPGRIDAVIEVTPPDLDAMLRMVRKYGANSEGQSLLVGNDEDLKEAIKPLVGANASFVREVVERSKLSAIMREGDLEIRAEDLSIATQVTLPHIRLLNPEHGVKPCPIEEGVEINPMDLAIDVIGQKFMEKFLSNITNPKILEKIVMKPLRKMGGGGRASMN